MQPVNDDMDNLYRRAAENYPLNPTGAGFDFSKVQQQLNSTPTPPPAPEKKRRRWLIWLLWLVPISFVMEHHYEQQAMMAGKMDKPAVQQTRIDTGNSKEKTATTNSQKNTLADVHFTKQSTSTLNNGTDPETAKRNILSSPQNPIPGNSYPNTFTTKKQQHSGTYANSTKTSLGIIPSSATFRQKQNGTIEKSLKYEDENALVVGTKKPVTDKNRQLSTDKENTGTDNREAFIKDTLASAVQARADSVITTDSNSNVASGKASSDTANNAKEVAAKKQEKKQNHKNHFAYIGAVAGADISTVKSTRTSGVGYNAGLLAGYQFNKHWTVQTGITWNFKKYYADGKYVSPDKLGLNPYYKIVYIDGSCGMIEIPVNIQYHFTGKKQHHYYVSAGLSSYLMKHEDYYYLYNRYNQPYYGEKEYDNSTKNWFSVLQLSAGYQLQIEGFGNLRAEPYIKLPLSGLGIAKLPMSSAGVNISYTLPLK